MFNDTLQNMVQAVYPMIKDSLALNFSQIGIITLVYQMSSSIFQPIIGAYTDRKPQPYSLPIGMLFTMSGILALAFASDFVHVLIAVFVAGVGSSVFHPEASRLAHIASGGKHGLAQSIFQVGGNFGGSLGPLLAALFIAPYGRQNIGWFAIFALICIMFMLYISRWYKGILLRFNMNPETKHTNTAQSLQPLGSQRKTIFTLGILLVLIFSKYVYMASLTSYYTFYLIEKFGITIKQSQLYLFAFLFAVALGTFFGGPIGDRFGRKYVIWFSILGTAPFALLMPHVGLAGTCMLSIVIGLILSSAFSAILVYAQELVPGKEGLIGGLFFGLAFGIAGIASAIFGKIADTHGIEYVYHIAAFMPLLGLIAGFLPNLKRR
ncbi:MFS transporter, FSR family, fosmidomycin resistance protein [Dysgonomonas macrotermitis]|uniref:MFS transporter, FSR family, fosmidomycin resistance protein n=2 Tax=Dysgonomonas macrotermitis TaxID=1346286 RepID=A0A1M5ATV2_9BACT|nr:MFS transporter, FSR family, fosmidomycin resistance protein [Dysgonomonas macrotermitis]